MDKKIKIEDIKETALFRMMDVCMIAQIQTESRYILHRLLVKPPLDMNIENDEKVVTGNLVNNNYITAKSTYPLSYLLKMLNFAKDNGITHVTLGMKTDKPIEISFIQEDVLSPEDPKPMKRTVMFLAPRVVGDGEETKNVVKP